MFTFIKDTFSVVYLKKNKYGIYVIIISKFVKVNKLYDKQSLRFNNNSLLLKDNFY